MVPISIPKRECWFPNIAATPLTGYGIFTPMPFPLEAISPEQREPNGHIDRKLSFPLEDLYSDGQPAGQVGQEVYGAGAASNFATRSFHHVEGAPFRLFCDHFLRTLEQTGEKALSLSLNGGETCTAGLSLVRLKRRKITRVRLSTSGGDELRPVSVSDDRIDFRVPADGRILLRWD